MQQAAEIIRVSKGHHGFVFGSKIVHKGESQFMTFLPKPALHIAACLTENRNL
jgi:hypothetical protein